MVCVVSACAVEMLQFTLDAPVGMQLFLSGRGDLRRRLLTGTDAVVPRHLVSAAMMWDQSDTGLWPAGSLSVLKCAIRSSVRNQSVAPGVARQRWSVKARGDQAPGEHRHSGRARRR